MSETYLLPPLSPSEAREIDQTCDRFEAAWKAGQRPLPEAYLSTDTEPVRSALLRQLLLLDWDCRRRAGDEPNAGDYHTRFPGHTALIENVCREMTESPISTRIEPDGVRALDTPWSGAEEAGQIDNTPNAQIDSARYELLQQVGQGGIGIVFRGRDRHLGRELAIKVLREENRDKPEARHRFTEEARVGSQLQHPAIVPVYELGSFDDRRPYFTMKLVEGHTLAALLQERKNVGQDSNPAGIRQDQNPAPQPDLPRWLGIFEQVCQAMAYAHARGVVHRDLKPANVMVGAFGEVQVMDWGFAKQLAVAGAESSTPRGYGMSADRGVEDSDPATRGGPVTQSGVLMGTPAYMCPEQARGEAALIDARADVFALGAILCEILTGRPPYVGSTPDEVCSKAAQGDLGDAHARVDACGADEALRELAKRCLAAERAARPPNAGVVARDLTAYLTSAQERLRQAQLERAAAEARAQEAGAKAKAERHARRLTLALAAAVVAVLTLAGGGLWWREQVQRADALRVAATDGKVEAALAEVADGLNRNDWPQARAAATRARELLESGASDHWKQRVGEVWADLDLVAQIDDIHLLQLDRDPASGPDPLKEALPRYAEAFARYGIRAGADRAEVAARIAQRPASVRDALVAGLESWWLTAGGRDAAAHDWLGAVLESVDADEWRTRVRRAVVRGDQRLLEELAVQGDAARQPQATVTSLAWALFSVSAFDTAIALLRPAQHRYPDDFWINFMLGQALRLCPQPKYPEALRYYSIAGALRPGAARRYFVNLGGLLIKQKDWDGAILVSRKAIELEADSAEAYSNLGVGLENKGDWKQAQAAYKKAAELSPNLALVHYNLGVSLARRGQTDQAIAAYERAIRLTPGDAEVHYGLGNAQQYLRKDFDAALAAYAKAIALNPGFAAAHNNRGDALLAKGRVDEAIAAYERASRLDPTMDVAHSNLGNAWHRKGRLDRAIAAHSRAIELNPKSTTNHYNLGLVLQVAQDLGGAMAAYREAIRLEPNYAEAHCNLGFALREQGQFTESLAAFERGHRLGSAKPDWGYPSAQWVKEAQRYVMLDSKLPRILDGSEKPADAGDQLWYAAVCKLKGLYGASARLYAGVFTAEPALAAKAEYRYKAACVAALAGSGRGQDAPKLNAAEHARWRKQALDWLRADLALWADTLEKMPKSRLAAQNTLQRWRREKALAGIREPEELAKLPESEGAACNRFWADARELLMRSLRVRK